MKKYGIKIFTVAVTVTSTTWLLISAVHAQGTLDFGRLPNPSRYDSLQDVVSAASSVIRPGFILLFAAMIIYGAVLITTARDNDEQIESAKKTIAAATIGFAIAVFAPTIADLILSVIGVEGFGTLSQ